MLRILRSCNGQLGRLSEESNRAGVTRCKPLTYEHHYRGSNICCLNVKHRISEYTSQRCGHSLIKYQVPTRLLTASTSSAMKATRCCFRTCNRRPTAMPERPIRLPQTARSPFFDSSDMVVPGGRIGQQRSHRRRNRGWNERCESTWDPGDHDEAKSLTQIIPKTFHDIVSDHH